MTAMYHRHRHRQHHYSIVGLIAVLIVTTIISSSVVVLTISHSTGGSGGSGGDGGGSSLFALLVQVAAFERPVSSLTSRRRRCPHDDLGIFKPCGGSFFSEAAVATSKSTLVFTRHDESVKKTRYKKSAVVALAAAAAKYDNNNDNNENEKTVTSLPTTSTTTTKKLLGRQQGVYTRPSAAIERGSGFFVPGLEGAKVRLVVGTVLLLLAAVNHFLSSTPTTTATATTTTTTTILGGNTLAEGLAVAYSLLVLVQAAIEYTKDELLVLLKKEGQDARSSLPTGGSSASAVKKAKASSSSSFQQQWTIPTIENDNDDNDSDNDDYWKGQVEWSAQTYLSLTPATNVMLIGPPGKIIYWIGQEMDHRQDDNNNNNKNDQKESEACALALELLSKSKTGRLSLPASHPIVTALFVIPKRGSGETATATAPPPRSVILQRISTPQSNNCSLAFLVSSNQLLASFTPQDLTWLGQLARALQSSSSIPPLLLTNKI